MRRWEGLFVTCHDVGDSKRLGALLTELSSSWRDRLASLHVCSAANAPWLGVERELRAEGRTAAPLSPEWFASLMRADEERWRLLCDIALPISRAWDGDVVSVEGSPEASWVRYARWRGGTRVRCFEYAANDHARSGWVQNEGDAETWEDDEEVGPDAGSLARVLGLPGFAEIGGPSVVWADRFSVEIAQT